LDSGVEAAIAAWLAEDSDLARTSQVFRETFDQLYDGQHTGRYRWDQLFKTEKTHYGTLLEINLRRAFDSIIEDGVHMDYRIAGQEIDCKYSQRSGGWMIPPEAYEQAALLLVAHADDELGTWQLGVVRSSSENVGRGMNRDRKKTLSPTGRAAIRWIAKDASLPPNVLLHLPPSDVEWIFAPRSGQERVNRLCRAAEGLRFGRSTVATVARQDDFMKRMRANGGARSALAADGFLIPSGDYSAHRRIAELLGAEVPRPGEFVSLRVVETSQRGVGIVELDGRRWRLAHQRDEPGAAPPLPSVKKFSSVDSALGPS